MIVADAEQDHPRRRRQAYRRRPSPIRVWRFSMQVSPNGIMTVTAVMYLVAAVACLVGSPTLIAADAATEP